MSPALAEGFVIIGPPGKSPPSVFLNKLFLGHHHDHWFLYCLRLLLCCSNSNDWLRHVKSLKYLLSDNLQKSLLITVLGHLKPLKNSRPGSDMIELVF